jgi:hypothetical protein
VASPSSAFFPAVVTGPVVGLDGKQKKCVSLSELGVQSLSPSKRICGRDREKQ